MFALISLEDRVPSDHPLRSFKTLADEALKTLSPQFDEMYEPNGRVSVPPEQLLKAMLLIALFSVRSERQFCEQLDYNLMFRWFLDMDMTEPSFNHSTFSRNRDRPLGQDIAKAFLAAIVEQASTRKLLSKERFSVDGTLTQAWASQKSFRPKNDDDHDSSSWSDFKGKKRSNETHEPRTDPEAKLFRKGRGQMARLCYAGHVLMENRNGLIAGACVTETTGRCEREAALELLDELPPSERRRTLAADRGYDTRAFVAACRERRVTPYVAQNISGRRSAIDGRATRHEGYDISIMVRRRIEEIFGWMKTVGGIRRTRFKGRQKTEFFTLISAAAYNLVRISRLKLA